MEVAPCSVDNVKVLEEVSDDASGCTANKTLAETWIRLCKGNMLRFRFANPLLEVS